MEGSKNSRALTVTAFMATLLTLQNSTILPWKHDTTQNGPSFMDKLVENKIISDFCHSNHQFLKADCEQNGGVPWWELFFSELSHGKQERGDGWKPGRRGEETEKPVIVNAQVKQTTSP